MRVVLDTNVLISAYVFPGGAPEAVYRLALSGDIELVLSRPLVAEFGKILEGKFGWEPARSEDAVRQLLRIATLVEPIERLNVIKDDPADNRVLEAAIAGAVDYIVSGDKHLLRLRSIGNAKTIQPNDFLSVVRA